MKKIIIGIIIIYLSKLLIAGGKNDVFIPDLDLFKNIVYNNYKQALRNNPIPPYITYYNKGNASLAIGSFIILTHRETQYIASLFAFPIWQVAQGLPHGRRS